ncbi:hypothetical protein KW787_01070 [Candidatus Pacearchaeota archaeon]|nr:hypothetical protein [Candidatus Pacearchaeota archaeon]
MKQNECVIPEHCIGCGRVFDVWSYHLNSNDNSLGFEEFFCDECQKHVSLVDDVLEFDNEEKEYELVEEFLGGEDASLSPA